MFSAEFRFGLPTRREFDETEDPVESIGVERAYGRIRTAQLVLAVFDGSQELDDSDRELTEALTGTPCVAVVNKSDLPMKIDMEYIHK